MTRLIDADYVLDGIRYIVNDSNEMITSAVVRKAMILLVDRAKTVDAEPVRHGEWVKMRGMMPPEYMGLKECSVCGWHIHPLGRTAFDLKESDFRYCPRCGARLDRERKDNVSD